jgi:mannose-1-phosphate guanylyltransferase/mannose-1-phosphate guanylyltransferase/mannose-6-phosphate isomerase
VEKPDRARAEALLAAGCWWNAGIFLFRPEVVLEELPAAVTEAAKEAVARARSEGSRLHLDEAAFARAPSGSFDVMGMERTQRGAVVPVDCGWSDLGTWTAVAEAAPSAGSAVDAPGAFVWSDGPPVVVLGVPDVLVAASAAGVLVTTAERAPEIGRHRPAGAAWTVEVRHVPPGGFVEVRPEQRALALESGEALPAGRHAVSGAIALFTPSPSGAGTAGR